MTSKTVAELLADLDITRSHSRPKVSNDNPYSESWFTTLKYAPTFPDRFGSVQDTRQFMDSFLGYNHHHRHTGIGLHTPADVHYGLAAAKHAEHEATLAAARQAHPEPFGTTTTPKIINLPEAACINQPQQDQQEQEAAQLLTPDGPVHLDKLRSAADDSAYRASRRGCATSRSSNSRAAATGTASSAPITPSKAPPTSAAITTAAPGMFTVALNTRGCTT